MEQDKDWRISFLFGMEWVRVVIGVVALNSFGGVF
jgi:hypothetical protein